MAASGDGGGKAGEAAPPSAAAVAAQLKSDALSAQQFLKVESLISDWERRVAGQVREFSNFADSVAQLDLDLCKTAAELQQLTDQQAVIERTQQELDAALDEVEKHQLSLSGIITNIEDFLTSRAGPEEAAGGASDGPGLPDRLLNLTAAVEQAEVAVEDLVRSVNSAQRAAHPGALGAVLALLNAQQAGIEGLARDIAKHKAGGGTAA